MTREKERIVNLYDCVRWMVGPITERSRVVCLLLLDHSGPHRGLTTYHGVLERIEWEQDAR